MLHLQSYKKDVFIMVISFKGVISRQVGLGVKANTRAYVFTEVSTLTSSTPDGAERSDNSSNSFK